MTKTYVVSGRGTRFDAARWPVPSHVEIHFYFQSPRQPQFVRARTLVDELMREAGMFPERVAVPGEMIPSHFCWSHPVPEPRSGVFRRHSGRLAMDLAGSTPRRPVAMSHIVRLLTVGRGGGRTVLHWIVPQEEHPIDPATLDCLYPSRLHGRGPDDEPESDHAQLGEFARGLEPWPDTGAAPQGGSGPAPMPAWPAFKRRETLR